MRIAVTHLEATGSLLLCTAGGILLSAPSAICQTNALQPEVTPTPAPAFEVASIKQNISLSGRSHIVSSPHDGHFTTINVTGMKILQFAFDMPQSRIKDAPEWLYSEKFDIDAKADSFDDALSKLSSDEGKAFKRKMVQALLAERLQLKVHRETRELPIYALVVAKGGPKLQETKAGTMINISNGHISIQSGDALGVLAETLAENLGRVVIDKTGIQGRYDITLSWLPDDRTAPVPTGSQASSPDASGPSIFTALQEQLGLKLEPQKGPVDVIVIDHIEPPSAN